MKKWIFAFIIIFFIFLLSYCGRDENKLTVQEKLKGSKKYHYIAYKEKINEKDAKAIKKELQNGDWKKSKIKLKKNPSDYIFYFNEDREDGAVNVYHLWMKVDPLRVTVYSEKKEMKLEGKEAKQLAENVLDVEFYQR